MDKNKESILGLSRRSFLRLCGRVTTISFLIRGWPLPARANSWQNHNALVGKYEFEQSFRSPIENVIYAGLGRSGQCVVSKMTYLAVDEKNSRRPLNGMTFVTTPCSSLSKQINCKTSIVHLIYAPDEVSINDVRTFLPTPSPDVLYHHLHITSAVAYSEPPLNVNEAISIIPQENITNIYRQQKGHKYFTDHLAVNAFMIKSYLELFQPWDYTSSPNFPARIRGTVNFLGFAYDPMATYSILIDDALVRLRTHVHLKSARLITTCIGGESKTLTMEEFDEGCRRLHEALHEECNIICGISLCDQSNKPRWVVLSAQKNINAPE